MSFTLTSTPQKTGVLLLSPSKRRRILEDNQTPVKSSTKECHSWTFSAESVAPCTVHDVLSLKPNEDEGYDFFWLGKVPCRSVKIVGIVIGIQIYEKKIIYTVDDGTGVIDCYHAHRPSASPQKSNAPSKYQRPADDAHHKPLKPVARMGATVRVAGNVRNAHETKAIHVTIPPEVCRSPNEELLHWRNVRNLHQSWYSRDEPFVVPKANTNVNTTPAKPTTIQVPSIKDIPTPSSVSTSPQKSSPIRTAVDLIPPKSPPRLRHPSRLHTHDLTENTFRIYVKHYMDHAPSDVSGHDFEQEFEKSINALPTTPTKRSRSATDEVQTPRPLRLRCQPDSTPKAGPSTISRSMQPSTSNPLTNSEPQLLGFTLSYLKRVPELSLLAIRVVQAVTKRRQREDRKRLKEAGVITSSSKTSSSLPAVDLPPEKCAAKVKRLFQWAVVQLLKEGCIILWDGPSRRCPETMNDASRLWKTHSSGTSLLADNTVFSSNTTSNTYHLLDSDEVLAYLSDPQPCEESYIPLTPAYIAPYVEKAIKVLVDHYEKHGKPYSGATKEGILGVLRKDDRWRYVGDWSVDDALEVLKTEGKVWKLRAGRWDLTE